MISLYDLVVLAELNRPSLNAGKHRPLPPQPNGTWSSTWRAGVTKIWGASQFTEAGMTKPIDDDRLGVANSYLSKRSVVTMHLHGA